MQFAVIMSSELGNRWDAGFHIFRKEWEKAANALKNSIPEDDRKAFEELVVERFKDPDIFSIEMLNIIAPLCRGSFPGRKGRDDFAKAAQEYPYLAVVAVSSEADRLMQERREKLELQAKKISDIQNDWKSMISQSSGISDNDDDEEVMPTDMDSILYSLPSIPEEIEELIKAHKFVAGVVYMNRESEEVIVSVNTGDYFISDCWVIDACDWKGVKTLMHLVESGEVPIPRRPEDNGTPVGFLADLPDHTVNYGMGWRH